MNEANAKGQDDSRIIFRRVTDLIAYLRESGNLLYVTESDSLDAYLDECPALLQREGDFDNIDGEVVRPIYVCISATLNSVEVRENVTISNPGVFASEELVSEINKQLTDPDSEVRKFVNWPEFLTFVYFDISDFSTYTMSEQALIINSLGVLARSSKYWSGPIEHRVYNDFLDALCIGDGYIFVFKDASSAVYFAARLSRLIDYLGTHRRIPIRFHFRGGLHHGPVYRFWDIGRKAFNYIGDGINGGQRVLGAVGKERDDVCYASSELRDEVIKAIKKFDQIRPILADSFDNRGRHKDKHNKFWRVYEIRVEDILPYSSFSV